MALCGSTLAVLLMYGKSASVSLLMAANTYDRHTVTANQVKVMMGRRWSLVLRQSRQPGGLGGIIGSLDGDLCGWGTILAVVCFPVVSMSCLREIALPQRSLRSCRTISTSFRFLVNVRTRFANIFTLHCLWNSGLNLCQWIFKPQRKYLYNL